MLTNRQKRYLWFVIACVAISLVVIFLILSLSANYNYCVSHSGQHTTSQYNEKGLPVISPGIGKASSFHLAMYCGGVFTNQNAGAITALATLLLMVITGGLVYLGYLQFTTSRAQLRAYVGVDASGLGDGAPLWPFWPCCNFSIKNTGLTPARNVRTWYRIDVGSISNPTLIPVTLNSFAGSNLPSSGTLHWNLVYMSRQLANNEITAIQSSGLAIHFYGIIKYEDIFGVERETHFRLLHTGTWPPGLGTLLYYSVDPGSNRFT